MTDAPEAVERAQGGEQVGGRLDEVARGAQVENGRRRRRRVGPEREQRFAGADLEGIETQARAVA